MLAQRNQQPGYVASGLANGTTYYYRITALTQNGIGDVAITSATPFGLPSAPLGLSAVPGEQSVTLNWQAPIDNGGSPILGYAIEQCYYNYRLNDLCGADYTPSGSTVNYGWWFQITPNSGTTATTYTVSGLTNGTNYAFRVAAVTAASLTNQPLGGILSGVGSASYAGVGNYAVTASAPVSLTNNPFTSLSITPGDGIATISFSGAPSPGRPIIGWQVEQSSDGLSYNVVMPFSDGTAYTATGLINGNPYFFRVTPMTSSGPHISRVVTTIPFSVPGAPAELKATTGNNSVTLTWKQPAITGGATITGYRIGYIQGGNPSASNQGTVQVVPASTNSYTFMGLVNGTIYGFIVQTITSRGEAAGQAGFYGAIINAIPSSTPSAPNNLVFSSVSSNSATLTWAAPTWNNGRPIIGYKVERGLINSSGTTDWTTLTTSTTATSLPLTGLVPGVTTLWRVAAINGNGTGVASLASLMTPTSGVRPFGPLKLSIVSADRSLFLTWQKPAYSNPNSYIVEYGTTTSYGYKLTNSTTATNARIDGLTNGTTYYVKVTAMQGSTAGGEVTGMGTPYTTQEAVTRLYATASTTVSGRVTVGWSAT